MKVAIHQPNFLPWIGFFHKIMSCDLFIFLDDVQFTKNSYQNRVVIKSSQNEQWLTLPIFHNFGQLTNEVKINNTIDWRKRHLKTLEMNYKKSQNFSMTYDIIYEIYYRKDWENMSEFNIVLIESILMFLDIKCRLIRSSELAVKGNSTDRLINLIKKVGGTEYLSGGGGSKYQDEEMFRINSIKLIYNNFVHPVYKQPWGDFMAGLSIIDFMFNVSTCQKFFQERRLL